MNMRGAFLHVLSDALGSIIVVISALVVWLTEWKYRYYMDPALSILLVILILNSVWPLLRESALILLQTVPTHIQVIIIFFIHFNSVNNYLLVKYFNLVIFLVFLYFIRVYRLMPFKNDYLKRLTVCWPFMNFTCGS